MSVQQDCGGASVTWIRLRVAVSNAEIRSEKSLFPLSKGFEEPFYV